MAAVDIYRKIIVTLLNNMAESISVNSGIDKVVIADHASDNYMLLFVGWDHGYREMNIGVYFRIRDGKIWLEANYGPDEVAEDLVAAGVPRTDIVLGFQPDFLRPLTNYAAAS